MKVMTLVIMFGVGLLYSTVRYPAETFEIQLMVIIVSLMERHPCRAGIGLTATGTTAVASNNRFGGN